MGNLSSRLVRFDPPDAQKPDRAPCAKKDAQSDSGDCVNSQPSIKNYEVSRAGAGGGGLGRSRCFL